MGWGLALFISGGTLGLGVSPIVSTWYVDRYGLENLIWLALPTVVAVILMSRSLPITNMSQKVVTFAELKASFKPNLNAMIILTIVVTIRTMAGIGFTMSLFVANLAFADQPELLGFAKAGILAGSLISGVCGFFLLRITLPRHHEGLPA